MKNLEEVIMDIIVGSGSARSYAMEAVQLAKNGDFDGAQKAIDQAGEEMVNAHHHQTDLIQQEARGEKVELSLLMVHAQDHLMTGMAVLDMAKEFIDLYKAIAHGGAK